MTSRGPFQPLQFCDSPEIPLLTVSLYRNITLQLASRYFPLHFFQLWILQSVCICILNFFLKYRN